MKDHYGNAQGKGAANAMHQQKMNESHHESNNEFIKRTQNMQEKFAGKNPELKQESLMMSSYMCNNGEHASELGRKVTAGLDKTAFPVK